MAATRVKAVRIGLVSMAIVMIALPALAEEDVCENVCGFGASCDTACSVLNPAPGWSPTCGSAGFPCGPAPCEPDNWVEFNRTHVGLFQKCWPFYCEVWGIQFIDEVSDTNCGRKTRTRCDDYMVDHWVGCADGDHGGYLCYG